MSNNKKAAHIGGFYAILAAILGAFLTAWFTSTPIKNNNSNKGKKPPIESYAWFKKDMLFEYRELMEECQGATWGGDCYFGNIAFNKDGHFVFEDICSQSPTLYQGGTYKIEKDGIICTVNTIIEKGYEGDNDKERNKIDEVNGNHVILLEKINCDEYDYKIRLGNTYDVICFKAKNQKYFQYIAELQREGLYSSLTK